MSRPETPLLEAAERALERLQGQLPRGAEAEVFAVRGSERGLEMRDGAVETLQESRESGLGVRVVHEGRMGFAYAAGLEASDWEGVFRQLLPQIPYLEADAARILPAPEPAAPDPALSASLSDPSLFQRTLEDELDRLRAMEAETLRADARVRRVLRAGYGESYGEVAIVSTRGVRSREGGTTCSVGLVAVAEKGDQVQVGSGASTGRRYAELDFNRSARDAAFRAGILIDASKPAAGRQSVLFDPWVAGELLDLVSDALSADTVQRGKSLFRGKLGCPVAARAVTIVDDPRRPGGFASATFDDEGVPTRRKVMIEGGVLREYFYDTYAARKDSRGSNGSAGRGSYRATPGPSSSNFYLEPGTASREDLLRDTGTGLLVLDLLGMHMADPVTGAFSVGISGAVIEGGALAGGFRGAMLSASVLEVLERVDAVASDLEFYGRIAAPTFRARDLMGV